MLVLEVSCAQSYLILDLYIWGELLGNTVQMTLMGCDRDFWGFPCQDSNGIRNSEGSLCTHCASDGMLLLQVMRTLCAARRRPVVQPKKIQ